MQKSKSPEQEPLEYEQLRARLVEAEDTLRAITSGEVDAVVVSGQQGKQVFSLKDALQPYQVMVEQMNAGALALSTEGGILYCNSRFAKMTEVPMERILGEPFQNFIAPRQRREVDRLLKKGQSAGAREELSLSVGKRTVPVEVSIRSVRLDGRLRLTVLVSDISERKQTEETLREQAEQYASLLSSSTDGYWLFNSEGRILDVNEAYCRMSGYTREEMLQLSIFDLQKQKDIKGFQRRIQSILKNGSERFEGQHRKKNGEIIDVEISATALRTSGNFIQFAHDISTRKEALAKLENYRLNLEEMVNERTAQLKDANNQLHAEIAERRRAEEELRASEEQAKKQAAELDAVIQSLPGAVTIYDKNGRAVRTNKLSDDLLGYTETIAKGSSRRKGSTPQVRGASGELVVPALLPAAKALTGELTRGEVLQIQHGEEEPLWISSSAAPIYKDGMLSGAVEVVTDITPIKAMEEALKRSEKKYRDLVKYAPVGIYQIDFRTRRFTSVNDVVCQQTGYTREELLNMSPFDILEEKSGALFGERIRKWLAGEKLAEDVEYRVIAKDGHEIYAVLNVTFTRDEGGAPQGATVVGYDITERKQAEEKLRRSQETFSELVERAPFGIYVIDSQFRIAQMNLGSQEGTFRNVRPLIGRDFGEAMRIIWPEAVAAEIIGHFHHTLQTGEPYRSPRFISPRQDVERVESYDWELHRMTLADGQEGVICYYYDSTKLRQAEAEAAESRKKYQALIETTSDFIWEMDPNGRFTYCSPQMESIWELKPEKMLGKTPFDLMPPEDNHIALDFFQEMAAFQKPFNGLVTSAHVGEGRLVFVETSGVPFFDAEGGFAGFRGISRDITERKQAEAETERLLEAVQAEKERLTSLVGSMTDEVWFADRNGKFTLANLSALREFAVELGSGLDVEAFAASLEVLRPDGSPRPLEETPPLRALRGETVKNQGEILRVPTSGQFRYREVSATPVRDSQGEIIGSVSVVRDVTERKQTEEMRERLLAQVERQAAELNSILESLPVGLSISDAQGKVMRLNTAAERILHLRSPELAASVAERMDQLSITRLDGTPITPEDSPTHMAIEGKMVLDSLEVVHRGGMTQYLNVSAAPVRSSDGTLLGVVTSFEDITARKQAETAAAQARLEAEQRADELEAIMDSVPVGLMISRDREGRFITGNRATHELLRVPPDEPNISKTEPDPENRRSYTPVRRGAPVSAEDLPIQRAAARGEQVREWDCDIVFSNGDVSHVVINGTPLYDQNGEPRGAVAALIDVTERKKAEEALQQSELRYRGLVEQSPDAVFVNRNNKITLVNQAALDLFGAETASQVLGKNPYDFFHPSSHSLITERIKTLFGGGSIPTIEIKVVRLDGTLRTAEVTAAFINDAEGPAAQVVLHDVTERRERELELKQLNRTLKALSSINQSMVHATDEAGYMQDVCRIVVEDCGHAMVWIGLAQEDEARSVQPAASAGFEEGYLETLNVTWADTERGRGPTGTAIRMGEPRICRNMRTDPAFKPWRKEALKRGYAASVSLPLTSDGKTFGAITIYSREADPFSEREMELLIELASDLAYGISMIRTRTAHAKAEEALNQSEDRFRTLADASFEGLVIHDKGVILDINTRITEMLGYKLEDLINKPFWEYIEAKYHSLVRERVRTGSIELYEVELIHKDGHRVPVEVVGRQMLWKGRQTRVSALRDITERRKAEAALRESEARYRSLFDSMSEGFALHEAIFDKQGRVVDYRFLEINAAFEALTGLKRENVVGHTHNEILPGDSPRWIEVYGKVILTGEPVHFDNYSPTLKRHYDVHAYRPAAGQFAAIFMDVTEQKRMEIALQKAREEAEQRANELDTVFNSIADGIIVYDSDGKAQEANRVAVNMLGFDPTHKDLGEIANTLSTTTMDGELLKLADAPTGRALSGQTVSGERYIIHNPQKADTVILSSSSPLWVGERIAGAVTAFQDVTEQYKAEEIQAWLASFPNLNPNPVTEIDENGKVQYMNPACMKSFPDLGTKGKMHPWLAGLEPIFEAFRHGSRSTATREIQVGETHYLQSISVVPENGRLRTYGIDITNRKAAERAVQRSNERLALLSEAVSQLLSSPRPEEAVKDLCREVLAHLDCQVFFNFLVDESTDAKSEDGGVGWLQLNSYAGIPAKRIGEFERLDFERTISGSVAREGVRIVVENIPESTDPRTDLLKSLGVKAYACHPLIVKYKVIGTLSFGTKTHTYFPEDDLALMKAITEHVAIAMGRYRAEQAVIQARDELEKRVYERTRELSAANQQMALERQRFNDVLDDLPAYLILMTPDYHISFANRYFEARFGKSEGRHCYEYLFNRSEPCEICTTYRTLKDDAPQRWEWTGPDQRNYDIHDFPFIDVDGSKLILEMGIDITERKQAEAELEKYRQHLEELVDERTVELANERANLQKIFDVVHVGLLLVSEDGRVERVNDVIRRWTGTKGRKLDARQPGDALGCIHALSDPEGCGHSPLCSTCQIRQTFQAVIKTGKPLHGVEVESSLQLRGKQKNMWLDISVDPLEVNGKQHAIMALSDVTDRKEAERALQQAHDLLERRVEQRTRELTAANRQLKEEVVERKRAEEELQNSFEELQVMQEELHSTNDNLVATQSKLEEERQKYKNLFDFAPIIYVTTNTAGVISEANKAAKGLLTGLNPGLEGLELAQFVNEADRSTFSTWLYQLQYLDGINGWETSLLLPTGQIRQVSINASRVGDQEGEKMDLHWLITDISERKQAEAQLHLQTSAMEAAANGIMITDRDGAIQWCNPAFAKVSGYSYEEVIGLNPRFLKSGHQNDAFYKKMWETLLSGEVWRGEMVNRRKSGETYIEEEIITPVRNEQNEISHFIAIKTDITARKEAEEALRLAYAYNRSLIEAGIDPLVTITPGGKIGDVNSATEKVTGRSRRELIGTDFHSYFSDPVKARLVYQMVFETGSVHDYELEIRNKDGHVTPVLYNGSVYRDEVGKVQGVFAVARDITDRKQFEAQLMQAEKHAVIGRMVGSVTHEINNPLQTIKNCLYLIQQDTPAESAVKEPLDMAVSETARLADLVGQLRELYRPRTDVQDRPHELLDIIEEVHSLLTPHLNNSKVQWKPLTGLTRCYINCVRDQILEVFLNISMNAIEAMQTGGGKLSVDMVFKGEKVGVVFKDTGPGIPVNILLHIFEPFMTTKNSGLGLGLSISYGIVQRHGGQINVENDPEGGAAFTVWLPLGKKSKKEKDTHATKR